MFLAHSVDNQTRNYDTKCPNHHPSLSTLRSKGLSRSKMKWWAIYANLPTNATVKIWELSLLFDPTFFLHINAFRSEVNPSVLLLEKRKASTLSLRAVDIRKLCVHCHDVCNIASSTCISVNYVEISLNVITSNVHKTVASYKTVQPFCSDVVVHNVNVISSPTCKVVSWAYFLRIL